MSELLPVPYFHVVFTLPHQLNPWIKTNPTQLLGTLFKAASQTLLQFGNDPKRMGATPGILMVLHTWGQKLNTHYHVHCIVTGGGLDRDQQWVRGPSAKFLFPVKAMSKVFRAIYLKHMLKSIKDGRISFPYGQGRSLPPSLYEKPWVVYAKRPFGGPEQVLKYLGRYTHRVAIANHRILRMVDNHVTFSYKDYRDNHQQKTLTLPLGQFLRRFAAHILPPRFMRIRGYGLWSNPRKKQALAHCRLLLGDPESPSIPLSTEPDEDQTTHQDSHSSSGAPICPHCEKGFLIPIHGPEPDPEPGVYDTS